jgi:hypothetical protein
MTRVVFTGVRLFIDPKIILTDLIGSFTRCLRRWFSPGTLASSTTKTSCHDIAEILLKVALKTQINQSIKDMVDFLYK